jgi:drug/metabolite transporter (DMT)-like permease
MITSASLILTFASAIIHPLWNMLLKRSEDKVIFYLNIHLIFTLLFSFLLFIYPVAEIDTSGWVFIILSSVAHFFYQAFLCRTYEVGEMSLTYPIARSSPIFVLVIASFLLQEVPSPTAIVGILLVVFGVHLINLRELSLSELIRPFGMAQKQAVLFALFTALFSAAYSIVDKKGALNMPPILFFYMFFAISGLMFLVYLLSMKERRKNYWRILKRDKFRITLASVLEFSSYVLILYAFRLSNVAYVVALRQISVIFGVLYGVLLLKERHGKARLLASCIIFLGSFLIIAFG